MPNGPEDRDALAWFREHAGRPFAFLLDANDGSRASYAGSEPIAQLIVHHDGNARRWDGTGWRSVSGDPIEIVGAYIDETGSSTAPSNSTGTIPAHTVGYLSYELGCGIDGIRPVPDDPVGAPLAVLSTYSGVHVREPETGRISRVEFSSPRLAKSRSPVPAGSVALCPRARAENADDAGAYRRGFSRIADAISSGEIYQANLTRSIRLPFDSDPLACFARLRSRQPVGHGAYLDLGELVILSNSPECFLAIEGERIETRPIKGTRARLSDRAADTVAVASLRADPKELAEHVMIVDLERNDLGRICEVGSVEVAEHAKMLSLATVHHLESRVCGRLRGDVGTADVLRAMFPGGSITGAPKIQAMRTIAEVEPIARGIYTGAIGAFHGPRRAELSIAIRTAVVARGWVTYGTGGGIVADSDPDREYEETVTKSRAFLDSLAETAIVNDARSRA